MNVKGRNILPEKKKLTFVRGPLNVNEKFSVLHVENLDTLPENARKVLMTNDKEWGSQRRSNSGRPEAHCAKNLSSSRSYMCMLTMERLNM